MTINSLKAGLAQISPIWLDRNATIEKVGRWICRAADADCQLVVFGETLIPGYPFWLSLTDGARFDSEIQKQIHSVYLEQAVCIEEGHLKPIAEIAQDKSIEVMFGCYERPADRGGHTGYASLVHINAKGEIANVHRKLVPTYEERLAWGNGDGHGLKVSRLGPFTIGGLNCWENWMPLARTALYAQGEDVHIAVWPGSKCNTADITRFIARESRSYVLSVCGILARGNIPDSMPHRDLIISSSPEILANGGSCVAGPDGNWVTEPVDTSEQLIEVTLDHAFVLRERQNFDPSGHYSRPDITKLTVNRERQSVVKWD